MSSRADWGYREASGGAVRAYEDSLVGPVFEPWAALLLDELGVQLGQTVLDVATGPGTVARIAATRVGKKGQVTACDLSSGMVSVASTKPTISESAPVHYLQCPASSMPLRTESFDVVVCQQGLQFFPDRLAALAEIRRVLKVGGRLGVSVWSSIDRCPPLAALASAIEAVMGDEIAGRFRAGPWGLPDATKLEDLINQAGFDQVCVSERHLPVTFDRGPTQLLASLPASGIAGDVESLDSHQRLELESEAAKRLAPLVVDGRVQSELTANIAVAVTPI